MCVHVCVRPHACVSEGQAYAMAPMWKSEKLYEEWESWGLNLALQFDKASSFSHR